MAVVRYNAYRYTAYLSQGVLKSEQEQPLWELLPYPEYVQACATSMYVCFRLGKPVDIVPENLDREDPLIAPAHAPALAPAGKRERSPSAQSSVCSVEGSGTIMDR